MKNDMNIYGLAADAWQEALPESPYDLCPCGCGKKMKYIFRDETEEQQFEHEVRFTTAWMQRYKQENASEENTDEVVEHS